MALDKDRHLEVASGGLARRYGGAEKGGQDGEESETSHGSGIPYGLRFRDDREDDQGVENSSDCSKRVGGGERCCGGGGQIVL